MAPQILNLNIQSDGDQTHRPNSDWTAVVPANIYLEKLATLWMQNHGKPVNGVKYYLDALPENYMLFEKPRKGNPNLRYKHLYGHPKHQFFDSPNRFYQHFEHLVIYGNNEDCPCTICNSKKRRAEPMRGRPRKYPRPPDQVPGQVPGSARTPLVVPRKTNIDTLSDYFDRLKVRGELNVEYEDKLDMDWRAEQGLLSSNIDKINQQRSWIPRLGEIVLFVRTLEGEISRDDTTKEFRVFDVSKNEFTGYPNWEAGVITQIPEEPLQTQDVIEETTKKTNVSYSGFRVEPLPDPLRKDKALSKQYKYIPSHHIRPFVFWSEYMAGIHESDWHPTINNALTVISSVSVLNKTRFQGVWPTADIHCRSMYLGSELICVGDAVRLLPTGDAENPHRVDEVLHVTSIRLHFTHLDKSELDEDAIPGSAIQVLGKAYTTDKTRAWSRDALTNQEMAQTLPASMITYKHWYPLHNPQLFYKLPFKRILGRLFEEEPMQLWFPPSLPPENGSITTNLPRTPPQPPNLLTHGLYSLLDARRRSRTLDTRILPGKNFLWTSTRAETLDIATMNGVPLSKYDPERDREQLDIWQRATRILEKKAAKGDREGLVEVRDAANAAVIGRPSAVGPMGIVAAAAAAPSEGDEDSSSSSSSEEGFRQHHHHPTHRPIPRFTSSTPSLSSHSHSQPATSLAPARAGLKRPSSQLSTPPAQPPSSKHRKQNTPKPFILIASPPKIEVETKTKAKVRPKDRAVRYSRSRSSSAESTSADATRESSSVRDDPKAFLARFRAG